MVHYIIYLIAQKARISQKHYYINGKIHFLDFIKNIYKYKNIETMRNQKLKSPMIYDTSPYNIWFCIHIFKIYVL